jgi:uncharacterized membrane protein YfcA
MSGLAILFGCIVGVSLGLTGGGGAILAVPLLVYGLGVPPREAVLVSLFVVTATAFVGFVQRALRGMVEFPTALLFGGAGMLAAPFGAQLAATISERLLMLMLAALMAVIAARVWMTAAPESDLLLTTDEPSDAYCRRDAKGRLRLSSRCAVILLLVGLVTGLLTGLFGVGGGFLIVPALLTFSGMTIQRAVGTSLLISTAVGVIGLVSHLARGEPLPTTVALPFLAGSVLGLFFGASIAHRVAGHRLQQIFAAAIILMAAFIALQSF